MKVPKTPQHEALGVAVLEWVEGARKRLNESDKMTHEEAVKWVRKFDLIERAGKELANLTRVKKLPPSARTREGDRLFEEALKVYPPCSPSRMNRHAARKAWRARMNEGCDPQEMINGTIRYRDWCVARGQEPEFIKAPATFFGPGRWWEQPYEQDIAPAAKKEQQQWLSKEQKAADEVATFYEAEEMV